MIAKLITLCCACAAALAAPAPGIYDGIGIAAPAIGYGGLGLAHAPIGLAHAPIAAPLIKQVVRAEPVDPNPAYSFSYGVADPATGDQKNAQETLQNGVVQGQYSLVEPDGHVRRVTYTADNVNGFNAVVERTGGAHAVAGHAIAKVVAPSVVAAAPLGLGHGISLGHGIGLGAVAHPWG